MRAGSCHVEYYASHGKSGRTWRRTSVVGLYNTVFWARALVRSDGLSDQESLHGN